MVTSTSEQEVAHVVAEGAADVAAAVGQAAGQTAAVEGSKRVGAVRPQQRSGKRITTESRRTRPLPVQVSALGAIFSAQEVSVGTRQSDENTSFHPVSKS